MKVYSDCVLLGSVVGFEGSRGVEVKVGGLYEYGRRVGEKTCCGYAMKKKNVIRNSNQVNSIRVGK